MVKSFHELSPSVLLVIVFATHESDQKETDSSRQGRCKLPYCSERAFNDRAIHKIIIWNLLIFS